MKRIIYLEQGLMSGATAWHETLTALGVPEADWGNVKSVELTVATIKLIPS